MSLKEKFKNLKNKLFKKSKKTDEKTEKDEKPVKQSTDSELSAEEVIKKETFPDGVDKSKNPSELNRHYRSDKSKACACKKPASKRTRPTNGNYKMIDPNGDSADTSKS